VGDAEGGFDWSDEADVRFCLRAVGHGTPFKEVLEFLATAKPVRWGPLGYVDPHLKKGKAAKEVDEEDYAEDENETEPTSERENKMGALELSDTFLDATGDRMSLPIRLCGGKRLTLAL
jgi:hypothetical protein